MQSKVTQTQNRITYLDGVCKEHEVSAVKHSVVHKSTLDEFDIVKVELDSAVRLNKLQESKIIDSQHSLDQMTEQTEKSRRLNENRVLELESAKDEERMRLEACNARLESERADWEMVCLLGSSNC
jgi:uncharacterized protein YdeI (YjbR/CyaY-like superfamily)